MLRRWFAVVLLVLPLRPVLALVPGQANALSLQIEHALAHESGSAHRHDDTLALKTDEDGSALPYAHHDAGYHSVLSLTTLDLHLPPAQPSARSIFRRGRLPDPDLEASLRPLRTAV